MLKSEVLVEIVNKLKIELIVFELGVGEFGLSSLEMGFEVLVLECESVDSAVKFVAG